MWFLSKLLSQGAPTGVVVVTPLWYYQQRPNYLSHKLQVLEIVIV